MRWLNRSHIDVATALSVATSAAIAVVAGRLAGRWTWSLFTALVGVVVLVAGLEIVRGRAARAEARPPERTDPPGWPGATDSVVALGSRSQAAGRDIRNLRIGTGGALGLLGVFLAAIALSGGTVVFGRYESERDAAPGPTSEAAGGPAVANPGSADQTYRQGYMLTALMGGWDIDPPDDTLGLADVSYTPSNGAIAFLNSAAVAPLPAEASPNSDVCRSAESWSLQIADVAAELGSTWCLRTSDGRYGTVSITDVNPGVGSASITATVWY